MIDAFGMTRADCLELWTDWLTSDRHRGRLTLSFASSSSTTTPLSS